ncbi:MAG: HD domain-containing protein [Planctomycetes bacterium]|nr:HD domain-containing protein [Planctomycetota bacterium]
MKLISVGAAVNRLPLPILNLCSSLEEKSPATAAHCRRVGFTALELAGFSYRFNNDELRTIFHAGFLHDLGKLVVPLSILDKPSGLSETEWGVIRASAICGESLLRPFLPPGDPVIDAVRHEHERWDGAGYPEGLYGEQIPVASRIVHIADTLDALRIHTSYRSARGTLASMKVLMDGAGSQFDPEWVDFACRLWMPSQNRAIRLPPTANPSRSAPVAHNNHELSF